MNEISVTFKNRQMFRNFVAVQHHPILVELELWFEERFGEPTVTSAFREGKTGVHSVIPLRGIDYRSHDYDDPKSIEEEINKAWTYDPERSHLKCALFHDIGQGAHIHLQVHPNTRKI